MYPARHGHSRRGRASRVYHVWQAMRGRCSRPSDTSFPHYGARGIQVCERWQTFELFLADMGEPPVVGMELDRIDGDGHYTPENCRWTTKATNRRNRSCCRLNPEAAKVIRALHPVFAKKGKTWLLAALHGVSDNTILRVSRGRMWAPEIQEIKP